MTNGGKMKEIVIDDKKIGQAHKPYIIAELSANHDGKIEKALEMLEAAAKTGVDAIKIQSYTADTMTIDCDQPDFQIKGGLWDGYKLYDLYKWAQTPFEWHKTLFDRAKELGVTLFSTPFDETAVDLLEKLNAPAYKIASFELTDLPLIKRVAQTGKPIIMSTGMANLSEIEDAVNTARDNGCDDIVVLHCISSYPSPIDQANLATIPVIAEKFKCMSGLSDHSLGTVVPVASIVMGACVIEKHFKLEGDEKGPDAAFSLEPSEFETLCKDTENAWKAIGEAGFEHKPAEKANVKFRRSIYFVNDLKKGHVVTEKDIRRIRPGFGLSPKHFDDIVGKELLVDVSRGTATSWEHFSS